MRSLTLIFSMSLTATVSFAQTTEEMTDRRTTPLAFPVSPATAGENVALVPVAGTVTRTGNSTLNVRLITSCFGTNLRSVSNPVSPDGSIEASLTIEASGQRQNLKVTFPGYIVEKRAEGAEKQPPLALDASGLPSGSRAVGYGPVVEMQVPVEFSVSVSQEGVTRRALDRLKVVASSFTQIMHGCPKTPVYGARHRATYPCGQYMGKSGPISANISPAIVAPDNSAISIPVAFPGQNGFCGGFYSPLMVFFDEGRPGFTSVSSFSINGMKNTAWPEAGAPGYFIAVDRDGSGKIDSSEELFGEGEGHENGFDALAAEDSNKDGKIDSKDSIFSKLVLWNDKDGDGFSSENEVEPIAKRLRSVSLEYRKELRPIGRYAEERQVGDAKLKNGKGEVRVIDVWLAPRAPASK